MDPALVARGGRHRFRQLADREVHTRAHVQELQLLRRRLPALQGEHSGLSQIIHMQEFPQRCARSPAGHARRVGLRGLVEAADQRRQHVAVGGVVVVARAIQIGGKLLRRRLRLQSDRIKPCWRRSASHSLMPVILAIAVPLVGGLQRPREQRLLADRVLGELRVDAAAAQKQHPPHPRAAARFDHLGLDLEVLQQKDRRIAAVCLDAAHLRGCAHHHGGLVFGEQGFHGGAIEQIELRAAGGEELVVAGALESAADGAAGHAVVAGHENAVSGGDQGGGIAVGRLREDNARS